MAPRLGYYLKDQMENIGFDNNIVNSFNESI